MIEENKIYKCAVCGNEHNTIEARIACETVCLKKQKEEARLLAEKRKYEEKVTRKKEVEKAIQNALELIAKYEDDYDEDFGKPCSIFPFDIVNNLFRF